MTRFVVRCNKSKLVMGMITAATVSDAELVCSNYFTADLWPEGVEMTRAARSFRLTEAPGYKKRLDGATPNFQKFALPGSRGRFRSQA